MTDGYSLSELLALPVWVFDMDGVVVDSSPLHAKAFREIFDEIGIHMGDYSEIAGKSTRDAIADILKRSGKPFSLEVVERLTQKKQERALELMSSSYSPVCTPGVVEFLGRGKKSGKLMCLVTSASCDRTGRTLDLLKLNQFFSYIVTSDDVIKGKPDPAPYLALLSLTAIRDPQSFLVFEDSINGIDAALVAGMRVIHYAFDSGKQGKAHAVVRSFDDLIRELKT